MMYNGGNFPFYEDKSLGVKILALPYKGLEVISENILVHLRMLIILLP